MIAELIIDGEPVSIYYDSRVYPPEKKEHYIAHDVAMMAAKYASSWGRVLDVGTGTGIIAIILAVLRPELLIEAVDNSEGALEVARINISRNKVPVGLFYCDLSKGLGHFDVIIANLPRLISGQPHTKGPRRASFVKGDDPMVLYRRLFTEANADFMIVESTPDILEVARENSYQLQEQNGFIYCFKRIWYNKPSSSHGKPL